MIVYIVSLRADLDPYELPRGAFLSLRSACRFAGIDHSHVSRLLKASNIAVVRDFRIERVEIDLRL